MDKSTQLISDPERFATFQKAMDFYTKKQFKDSISVLKDLESDLPSEIAIKYFIGENHMALKQFTQAVKRFIEVYKLNDGNDYHRCISNICMLISKNVVIMGYNDLLNLYKTGKNIRVMFLLLEQLNKKILYNQALYCTLYAPVVKKLLNKSDHMFLSLYSRLVYPHSLFRALLQGRDIDGDDGFGWEDYYKKLELLTDIPINCVKTNFVKLFADILFLQGNINHTALSYLRNDNLVLYRRVSQAYRKLFPVLNEVGDVKGVREKVHINLFIVCKKLLMESSLLYRWYNHIVALAGDKRFNVYIVSDKVYASPYSSMLLGKVKGCIDTYGMGLFGIIDTLKRAKPDLIIYLDPGRTMADYMLAHCRFAPIQCSTFEFPERVGVDTIDYYISCDHFGKLPNGGDGGDGEDSKDSKDSRDSGGVEEYTAEKELRLKYYPFSFVERCVGNFEVPIEELPRICMACTELFDIQFYKMLGRLQFKWNLSLIKSGCPEVDRSMEILLNQQRLHIKGAFLPPTLFHYTQLLSSCRIGLDSYPNSNLGMCVDMLGLGKPVVTLFKEGDSLRSSYIAVVLREIGLDELIARSEDEYMNIVNRLMKDNEYYLEIVQKVKNAKSKLFGGVNKGGKQLVDQLKEGLLGFCGDKIKLLDKRKHFFGILKQIKIILEGADIQFFLTSGTLLGYYREGNILEHDKDIDIGIMQDQFVKAGGLERIIELMTEGGFELSLILGREDEGMQISFGKDEVGLDIFVYYPYGTGKGDDQKEEDRKSKTEYLYMDCYYRFVKRLRYLYKRFELKQCEFLGEKFMIPDNVERHLLDDYGEGWSVPDPGYCWFTQPNSIYPYGYGYVDGESWREVLDLLKKRVYKRIVLFVKDSNIVEDSDFVKEVKAELGKRGEVVVLKSIGVLQDIAELQKELCWRIYSHPNEFSCFCSKLINGKHIAIIGHDMACLDIESNGYGVVEESSDLFVNSRWRKVEEWDGWRGVQVDWKEFSEIKMNDLLTVPEQYQMYGELFFKIVANKITEQFGIKEDSRVLEIGAGVGAVAQHMECNYVGVDSCEEMINRHLELSPSHKMICCSGEKLEGVAGVVSGEEDGYDLVFIWNSLNFFKDLECIDQVLREMERVVKKGKEEKGWLFLGDVDTGIWNKDYFLFNGWQEVEIVGGSKRYLHFCKRV